MSTGAPLGGFRFPIGCLLDGRTFENFHLDLGQGDPVVGKPEKLTGPPLLEFARIPPLKVSCYPPVTQIAEKVHAFTRPYSGGESSRTLGRALKATFKARATHQLPQQFPEPPVGCSGPYKKLARELGLRWSTVDAAGQAAGRLLNPVLRGSAKGRWQPERWRWKV